MDHIDIDRLWSDGPEVLAWYTLHTTLARPAAVAEWYQVSGGRISANDAYGGIDVVVANAGIGRFAPPEAVTEDDFDALCAIHLRGAFFTAQAALPYLRPGAAVVLISSTGAQRGFPTTGVYNAVKAGVRALGRTFAAELAPRGIRVNTVRKPPASNSP